MSMNYYFKLCCSFAAFLFVIGCSSSQEGGEEASAEGKNVNWTMYGNDYTNQRYSELDQINDQNVGQLTKAWDFDLNVEDAQENTPVVVDGTMYVTTANGPKYVYALDAVTGEKKWEYTIEVPADVARFACCGIVNRGVTYSDGKVFFGRLDGKLTALDAETGQELWTTTVVDYKQGSVITSPPLVVDGMVMSGFGGGEYGATGYLSAYDVNTGEQVWRTYTVPGDEVPAVRATWKGDSWKTGGAVPWFIGSYDEKTGNILWGTSNPSPWNSSMRGSSTTEIGDMTNLYSASTLQLNKQGEITDYYQSSPFDAWDYDGVNEKVLATLNIDGQDRDVYMQADRNGFYYVVDRNSMDPISAGKFVSVNWAEGIDYESGMPIEVPEYRPTINQDISKDNMVYPSFIGGKNWQPMAFSPKTGLTYIPANNLGMSFTTSEVEYQRGYFYLGAEWEIDRDGDKPIGEYIAWDPVKQEKAWSVGLEHPIPGGAATTAGNLVFFGHLGGEFEAYNATTGEKLWSTKTDSGVGAAPMTYMVDGKQYVAIVDGRPTVIPGFIGGDIAENMISATPAGGKLHVYALPDAE